MGYGIPAQLISSPSSTGYSMVTGYPAILAAVSCDGTPGGTVSVYDGTRLLFQVPTSAQYTSFPTPINCTTNINVTHSGTGSYSILYARTDSAYNKQKENAAWDLVIPSPTNLTTTVVSDEEVFAMCEFNGLLYIGYYTALGNTVAKLYKWNGSTLTLAYNFGTSTSFRIVSSLCVYGGNLYAGIEGSTAGAGDIYVSSGTNDTTWTKSYEASTYHTCFYMATYGANLYAAMGWNTGEGDVLQFDGVTWTVSLNNASPTNLIEYLGVHGSDLYASGGGPNDGNAVIYKFDGATWTTSYSGTGTEYTSIISLVSYNGELYAGAQGAADVLKFNGSSWSLAYRYTVPTLPQASQVNRIHGLCVYDGKLFVGIGNIASYNAILIYNGHTWTTSFVGNYEHEVFRLVPALGGLYAGMGYKHGMANIYKYKG